MLLGYDDGADEKKKIESLYVATLKPMGCFVLPLSGESASALCVYI